MPRARSFVVHDLVLFTKNQEVRVIYLAGVRHASILVRNQGAGEPKTQKRVRLLLKQSLSNLGFRPTDFVQRKRRRDNKLFEHVL